MVGGLVNLLPYVMSLGDPRLPPLWHVDWAGSFSSWWEQREGIAPGSFNETIMNDTSWAVQIAGLFVPGTDVADVADAADIADDAADLGKVTRDNSGYFRGTQMQEAIDYATSESKLEHIIDPPKHGFDSLVQAAGGRKEAMTKIVQSLGDGGGLPASGPF